MQQQTGSVEEYFKKLPAGRSEAMQKLRLTIKENLPKGFEEVINYKMPSFVVPHSIFPQGYHCNPALPLGFISIASQKNFIALYHMGIYADPKLFAWFVKSYNDLNIGKPDIGKSCIRFKKLDNIPYNLIAALAKKISVQDWIYTYSTIFTKQKAIPEKK